LSPAFAGAAAKISATIATQQKQAPVRLMPPLRWRWVQIGFHDVSSRKPTRERVRSCRLALITSQRQVSQQLTDGAISIGAFPLSSVCSQPRPSR
jgi:hypothetical protein